jgi:hypothetical protein
MLNLLPRPRIGFLSKIMFFFRPHLSQGIPPNNEPRTVPHNAIDIINIP